MSRSNYSDDCDEWDLIRWRGAVASAIKGKKGQSFLRELATAMDAMPQKRLIDEQLIDESGEVCALGVVCKTRQLDVSGIDVEDSERISKLIGIADALVREIEFLNDDYYLPETAEQRWARMRKWAAEQIKA
jgi:hypothetical protein